MKKFRGYKKQKGISSGSRRCYDFILYWLYSCWVAVVSPRKFLLPGDACAVVMARSTPRTRLALALFHFIETDKYFL